MDFGNLFSVGFIRFISIKYPLKRISNKSIYLIWLLEVICAAAMTQFGYLVSFSFGKTKPTLEAYFFSYASILILCAVICLMWNLTLWQTLRKSSRLSMDNNVYQKHKKASNRLIVFNIVYIICGLPFAVMLFVMISKLIRIDANTDDWIEQSMSLVKYFRMLILSYEFHVVYSGLNAIIYVWFDRKIMNWLMSYCRQLRGAQRSQSINNPARFQDHITSGSEC